jgi:GTP:adenosylcobinamide-phosphate guanylyltransferase
VSVKRAREALSMRVSLVIMAGGRATRLGGVRKTLLDVGGRPIIRRILDELGPLADEQLLLANDRGLLREATAQTRHTECAGTHRSD